MERAGSTPVQAAFIAGLTSGLRRQFHMLIFVGSNPTPATYSRVVQWSR